MADILVISSPPHSQEHLRNLIFFPVLLNLGSTSSITLSFPLTSPGERPFSGLDIGGGLNDLLFELSHSGLAEDLERSIATTINNFEPRVILQDVNVELIPERNAASIQITYSIRMTNTTETFDLFLERA